MKTIEEIKKMNLKELDLLSHEIREFLINSVSKTGGHLASNLGVVELTVALHYVFDSPVDKIIFDVGHQSYIHKILTGRSDKFDTLRKYKGLSGFQKKEESIHDVIDGGHSSTSIATALGFAYARDLDNKKEEIIAVIGDGALTGGLALEALNHISTLNTKIIIILNDNSYSINENVGGMSEFLTKIRVNMLYNKTRQNYKEFMNSYKLTRGVYKVTKFIKNKVKKKMISNLFTDLNIEYLGPIDGHDYRDLIRALNKAKAYDKSVLVHVVTKKGKGYSYAEESTNKWHGVTSFDPITGIVSRTNKKGILYSEVISNTVYNFMEKDKDIVVITPAMIDGSKLEKIFNRFKDRSIDTGITEQYATLLSHSLALSSKKPFLSIYSSFLQRSFDQVVHDIARMKSHVVVGIDRAGLVGEDGDSHHGVFDIAFLRSIPNIVISEGKDALEVKCLLYTGFYKEKGPFFIRYEKEIIEDIKGEIKEIEVGTWEYLKKDKKNPSVIISYGSKVIKIYNKFKEYDIDIINARYIKPMDFKILDEIKDKQIFVYETNMKSSGLGSAILEYYSNKGNKVDIRITGIEDHFVEQGSIEELLHQEKLDIKSIEKEIKEYFNLEGD